MPSPYSGKVFPFDHNWTEPLVEKISWLTSVLRKRDGSEQRMRLRMKPRRAFEYSVLIGGQDELDMRRRFDALMRSQDEEILVPFWPDATVLANTLSSGASSVPLTSIRGFDIDNAQSYIIFWKDYRTYEVLKVNPSGGASTWTDPATIGFETNTLNDWLKGTTVVPARLCRHAPIASSEIHASDIKTSKVGFQVITPVTPPSQGKRAITPSLDTYVSTDVLADPGMNGDNTSTIERVMSPVDFQVGQFSYDSIQTAPFGTIDINIDISGKEEVAVFLGWLNTRQGRQKAFWMPTWEKDFDNIERTGDDTFTADSFGYTAAYNSIEGRRDIAFIAADGSMEFRRIAESSDDDTTETITVTTEDLPDPLEPERTSFLRYCRLDQDEVQLNWLTTDDVTAQLKARELIKTA